MKWLLVLLLVVALLWWLKSSRRSLPGRDAGPSAAPRVEPMISCAHCGVHLPRREAVAGVEALYCSDAHRLADGD
ncbi:MAG TPA: PP0621 family protein [Methylibium sp.]|uniref:PP0621 family protein n=1 Tax=Methylibium sp. TaxID=2067992 RepID=UPI002DB7A0D2|nr:PP0621 family protein [Methylibium sp.]HEU4457922.1 PP0621 family protein [Methylibium sp.]